MQEGRDASEADLDAQMALREASGPLDQEEFDHSITFFNNGANGFIADDPAWVKMENKIA